MTTLPIHLLALDQGHVSLADETDDVRGLVVLDANGHRVGEVDDLIVDRAERRARLLVVASGGVLGLGAHRRLLPVEAVAHVGEHVRLHHAEEAMPQGEDADSIVERGDYAAVYSRYGCTPFWDATYTSPYFHDRRW
jgi:sporulation protein YlmC with PRC-barrel domain